MATAATNTQAAPKPAGAAPVKPPKGTMIGAANTKPATGAVAAADKRTADKTAEKEAAAKAKAAKEKAAADKKAEAEKAKAKKLAEFKKIADPLANEIKVRMEKAEKLDAQSDDHRVAAALQLAKAAATCKEMGQSFEKWCAENIPNRSFETLRKLSYAGAKEDVKLAISDMRAGNAAANRTLHKKKKAIIAEAKNGGKTMATQPPAPELVARDALATVSDAAKTTIVQETAKKLGLAVVTVAEAKAVEAKAPAKITATVDGLKVLFQGLDTKGRLDFVEWAAKMVGATVTVPDFMKTDADDAGPIPDFLKK